MRAEELLCSARGVALLQIRQSTVAGSRRLEHRGHETKSRPRSPFIHFKEHTMTRAFVAAALIALTACSDAPPPLGPDAQFKKDSEAGALVLKGHVWGGLMSSQKGLEDIVGRTYKDWTYVGQAHSPEPFFFRSLHDVEVLVRDAYVVDGEADEEHYGWRYHLYIPIVLKVYGDYNFYCIYIGEEDPEYPGWLSGDMAWDTPSFPTTVTGLLWIPAPRVSFRSAADFRAWLLDTAVHAGHGYNPVLITYDEECRITSSRPTVVEDGMLWW
jgi:hypothetical protein